MSSEPITESKRTPKRKRRAGAASSISVSAETAAIIERLQEHFSEETGFAIDRVQVVARAVRGLCNEVMPVRP